MNFAVFGASGRMGAQLAQVGFELGFTPYLGFYYQNKPEGYLNTSNDIESADTRDVQCLIDFSLPVSLSRHVALAKRAKKPLVTGVTGLEPADFDVLLAASKEIPVLWSPNFSLGIALFKSFLKDCSKLKSHFDFQIEEIHHTQKKDAPSGTAKYLQEALLQSLPAGSFVPDPIAIRAGGVIGEHSLRLFGQYESIEIKHSVSNRKVFALGALEVAHWLVQQPPGFYKMDDFFKNKLD